MTTLFARFYSIDHIEKNEGRSYLDIITDGDPTRIDLLLIMLNPGSCSGDKVRDDGLVEVEPDPDPTLKRIIKVLHTSKSFKNCRVINLCDVKNPNSKQVFQKSEMYFNKYSIFSESRREELKQLARPGIKAWLAWGRKVETGSFARNAIIQLKSCGISIVNEDQPHYHPLVRKNGFSWAQHVLSILPN